MLTAKNKQGNKLLVCSFGGSPLSGMNHCTAIRDDGKRETTSVSGFSMLWRPFTFINCRYDNAKCSYQAYSLQEVLDILKAEDDGNSDFSKDISLLYLRHELEEANKRLEQEKARSKQWKEKYYDAIASFHEQRCIDFYAKYERTSAELNSKIDSLIQQKRELKRALKSGRMDNVTYQKTLTPLKERIRDLEYEISNLRYEGVMEAFPDVPDITFDVIECYVLNKRNGQNSTDA